jgi:hypothetical protein
VKLEYDPFLPFAAAMTQKNLLSKRRLVVRWVGIMVLLLGLVSAGVVYSVGKSHSAKPAFGQERVDIDSRDDTLSFDDSKTSSRGTVVAPKCILERSEYYWRLGSIIGRN